MKPVRGEVWLFDLGMAEKVRPALVIGVAFGDADRALVTIVPVIAGVLRWLGQDQISKP
jgi:mRNA interferase MazF